MTMLNAFTRLVSRFRYPVSMPEDVAQDLGLLLPNTLSYCDFLSLLNTAQYRPTKLWKMMPRELAEMTFKSALKREEFRSSTLFSYYFNKSWLVFALYFDEDSKLRRLHLQCPSCVSVKSFDILLDEEFVLAQASSL
ncbi:MAG: hypothetical protein S4CHLAM45_08180 [Chlamydiales bacterium]|nr:hypothetical protein [Chlamydiales bacterium]MCH9620430.1 hypothetical protein [Chlamydiales bacterium]MCH9622924.1 hypothetical protein [Chlamydiales bacterium]